APRGVVLSHCRSAARGRGAARPRASGGGVASRGREHLAALVAVFDDTVLDLLEGTLVYVWRRHLMAALGRRLETDDYAGRGSRRLRRPVRLHQAQPAGVRGAVERAGRRVRGQAFDVVSAHGGRAVKLIGDEMMFVVDSLPV